MQINFTFLYKRNDLLLWCVWLFLPIYTLDCSAPTLSSSSYPDLLLSSLTLHYSLVIFLFFFFFLLLYSANFQKTTAQSSTPFSSISTLDVTSSKGSAETSLFTSTTFGKEDCFLRSWVVCSMLLNLAYYNEVYDFQLFSFMNTCIFSSHILTCTFLNAIIL